MTITTLPEHLKRAIAAAWLAMPAGASHEETEEVILAFLNACLEGGVAREAIGCAVVSDWVATTGIHCDPDDFPVLILSLGEAK